MLPSRESNPQEQELGKRGRRRGERHQSLQADKAVSWSGPHQCAEWSRHLVCNYEEYMNVYRIEMGRKKWKPQLLPKYSWGESNWNNSRRKLLVEKNELLKFNPILRFLSLNSNQGKNGWFPLVLGPRWCVAFLGRLSHGNVLFPSGLTWQSIIVCYTLLIFTLWMDKGILYLIHCLLLVTAAKQTENLIMAYFTTHN